MSTTVSSRPTSTAGEESLIQQECLFDRIVARDQLALLEALERTGAMVFCVALLLTGQRAAAEALTEALFVELWRTPHAFPPTEGPLGLQMIHQLVDRL
jgi:hypothetical protein